ncbi:hypothetical protein GHT06_017434 [Daphnia sinensis]|uniref:Uncharacterized protein n=1 Tax=Daphnia sinensis TaxID=1820382 RepID=A0AAD5L7N1_9CRUS|nr:hypothetical protein GHT06_017434 [Daphnia sinensis]
MNGFSTGSGEEDSRDSKRSHDQHCCLIEYDQMIDDGERCPRMAGNASYRYLVYSGILKYIARHIYICDYHKSLIQSVRVRQRKRKDSEDDSNETDRDTLSLQERERDTPEVDLFQLQINTLRRYKRHYKVPTRPGLNKAQLAETLMRHFRTIPVVEKEALHAFLFTVKSNKNKLDLKPNNDNL